MTMMSLSWGLLHAADTEEGHELAQRETRSSPVGPVSLQEEVLPLDFSKVTQMSAECVRLLNIVDENGCVDPCHPGLGSVSKVIPILLESYADQYPWHYGLQLKLFNNCEYLGRDKDARTISLSLCRIKAWARIHALTLNEEAGLKENSIAGQLLRFVFGFNQIPFVGLESINAAQFPEKSDAKMVDLLLHVYGKVQAMPYDRVAQGCKGVSSLLQDQTVRAFFNVMPTEAAFRIQEKFVPAFVQRFGMPTTPYLRAVQARVVSVKKPADALKLYESLLGTFGQAVQRSSDSGVQEAYKKTQGFYLENPFLFFYYNELGALYQRQDLPQKARDCFEMAAVYCELAGDYLPTYFNALMTNLDLQDYQRVIFYAQKIMNLPHQKHKYGRQVYKSTAQLYKVASSKVGEDERLIKAILAKQSRATEKLKLEQERAALAEKNRLIHDMDQGKKKKKKKKKKPVKHSVVPRRESVDLSSYGVSAPTNAQGTPGPLASSASPSKDDPVSSANFDTPVDPKGKKEKIKTTGIADPKKATKPMEQTGTPGQAAAPVPPKAFVVEQVISGNPLKIFYRLFENYEGQKHKISLDDVETLTTALKQDYQKNQGKGSHAKVVVHMDGFQKQVLVLAQHTYLKPYQVDMLCEAFMKDGLVPGWFKQD